jgi:hypothetical protein
MNGCTGGLHGKDAYLRICARTSFSAAEGRVSTSTSRKESPFALRARPFCCARGDARAKRIVYAGRHHEPMEAILARWECAPNPSVEKAVGMRQAVLHADREPTTTPAEIAAIQELEHARSECARLRRIKDWGEDLRAAEIRARECDRRLVAARRLRIVAEHGSRPLKESPEAQGICPERDRLFRMATSCVAGAGTGQ